ncbi:DNA repair protein RadC [Candidatus Dojkabacteria bacterium]|uniref:DNA repair protein RadC n=1 Tax=Candidatus Dojkabacteria bacterium TaxID=2099670 RepID=A0A955KWH3_9BACT|nr:DNA repair protein RadC [Candidatus Dojkabacteria bacterium]
MQPREKVLYSGLSSLTDVELVAAIIGSGVKGASYTSVASNTLRQIRSCKRGVLQIDPLLKVNGIGQAKAVKLLAGIELGRRIYDLFAKEAEQITSTEDSIIHFNDIRFKKREYVKCLFLNARYDLLLSEIITVGTIDRSRLLPRDVIAPAIETNASSIILGHNHPSGNPTPSTEDILVTSRVYKACEIVGIKLLDHVVVTPSSWEIVPLDQIDFEDSS